MQLIIDILNWLYVPQQWFLNQSQILSMSIVGVCIAASLTLAGFVLARLGYKPLWAILLIVPTLNIIMVWVCAIRPFPIEEKTKE
jgi:hypothetical protein